MIKFSNIILENSKRGINEFIDLVKKDEWVFKEPLIYRGRSGRPDFNFKARKKRERSGPKDTDESVNKLVNCLHSVFLPDFPHRSRSVFGTYNKGIALDYGNFPMLIIPHKSSKINWSEYDAYWKYFRHVKSNLNKVLRKSIRNCIEMEKSEHHTLIYDLINGMKKAARGNCGGFAEFKKMYASNPFKKITMFQTFETRNEVDEEKLECFLAAKKAANYLSQYVGNLHLGYPPEDKKWYETIIEGPYLYVDYNHFVLEHGGLIEQEFDIDLG